MCYGYDEVEMFGLENQDYFFAIYHVDKNGLIYTSDSRTGYPVIRVYEVVN